MNYTHRKVVCGSRDDGRRYDADGRTNDRRRFDSVALAAPQVFVPRRLVDRALDFQRGHMDSVAWSPAERVFLVGALDLIGGLPETINDGALARALTHEWQSKIFTDDLVGRRTAEEKRKTK